VKAANLALRFLAAFVALVVVSGALVYAWDG
jgi:hypothetical protein